MASGAAFCVTAATSTSFVVRPSWTGWPVISANMVAPTAQRSARASTSSHSPRACSGAMKAGVPIVGTIAGRVALSGQLAQPRDAEIEHHDPTVARQEHVLGFEIAVDDTLGVRRDEHVQELVRSGEYLVDGELAASACSSSVEALAVE